MPPRDDDTLLPLPTGNTYPANATPPGSASEEIPAGSEVGDYVIGSILGRGGAGMVYLATRKSDGRQAAIKVLSRVLAVTAQGVARFLREVETVHRVKHPNIVDVYDVGRLPDERPYYAMELLEGTNLRRLLADEGRMSPTESLAILEGVCAGLAAAHAAGVVHRDLKAENVMVGVDRTVKLVDFGIAKLLKPETSSTGLTTTGQFLGTPVAMAPEQIRGTGVDERSDIYALGVLVYNILTGSPPFRGNWEEVVRLHLGAPPRRPSELVPLSPALDSVVLRCLEKEPAARFPTVQAFLQAYRAAVHPDDARRLQRSGVGVLVRASASDDDDVIHAALALDDAGAELRAAGYQIALETSQEVLGVHLTRQPGTDEADMRRRAIDDAHRIHDQLTAALPPGVQVSITVHHDELDVREGSNEIAGGRFLEIGAWASPNPGVTVTPSAEPTPAVHA